MNHAKTCFVVENALLRIPARNFEEQLAKHLKKDYFDYHIEYCDDLDTAKEITQKCVADGYEFLIACGGNTLVNSIARLLVRTRTSMGIIPLGKFNGLASHLKINYTSIADSLETMNRRTIKQIDTAGLNEYFFTNIAGLGFDAALVKRFNKQKLPVGFALMLEVLKVYFKEKKHHVRVLTEDEEYSGSAFWVVITNGKQYENRLYINPRASISDGMIEVCIFKKPGLLTLPFFVWNLIRKNDFSEAIMLRMRAKEFYIENRFPYLQIDGTLIEAPHEIRVISDPHSLKILVNK